MFSPEKPWDPWGRFGSDLPQLLPTVALECLSAPQTVRGTRTLDLPVVEMIPSGEMLEDIMPSPVHEITLDDAVGQQEEAIKRAMELMDSIKGAEEPPAAVPTLPPPPAADAAPAVPSESEDDSKLLADISTLLAQANVLMEKPVSDGEAKAED